MKKYILRWVIALFLVTAFAFADSIDDDMRSFMASINTAWTNRDYATISNLINSRLAENSNDVYALALQPFYYMFAAADMSNAQATAVAFTNMINSSQRTELNTLAYEVWGKLCVPTSETISYSDEQRSNLHKSFPETFPSMEYCTYIALKFYHSKDIYFESSPSSGVPIELQQWDETVQKDGTTSFRRVYFNGLELSFTAPNTHSNTVFFQWLKDGVLYGTNNSITFTVETNATFTAVYTNAP